MEGGGAGVVAGGVCTPGVRIGLSGVLSACTLVLRVVRGFASRFLWDRDLGIALLHPLLRVSKHRNDSGCQAAFFVVAEGPLPNPSGC